MQIKSRDYFLITLSALFIFTSCKKSNTQGRHIPKNAAFVLHVNGESINSKLPWEEIKKNEAFQSMYADTSLSAYMRSAMDNPENTGIDIKNDFIIFFQKDSAGDYLSVQGVLKDAAKFRQFNNEVHKTTTETEKEGIHFLSNDQMTASWNKDKFILVMNEHGKGIPMNMNDSMPRFSKPFHDRDLNALSSQLFALSEDNSLAKDERFSQLLNTKGDLHFWVNGQTIGEGMVMPGPMSMVNMSKLYEGSLVTGTASFDEGQINADIKSYSGKEMGELWKKYGGEKINNEMVKRIPSKDIALLMALSFKPEGLKEFLKVMGLEGFANMGTNMYGFTLDDLVKGLKGDVVLSVSNISRDSMGKHNFSVLFSPSIADKASFEKLVNAGNKITKEKLGDTAPSFIFHNTSAEYFAIGNNKADVDAYIQGNANNNFPFLDKISGNPLGVYINFQYLMNSMQPSAISDSLSMASYNASVKMWDNLLAYGGKFSDGGISEHIEINLLDKKTNSLKQLNNYLGVMAGIDKMKKSRQVTFEVPIPADSIKTK
ncbi:MAG TPA: DUF4836 family protein [Ferruginibacter sp.]|nr:DUF4836 family protein [Ferruginibacter sp.]